MGNQASSEIKENEVEEGSQDINNALDFENHRRISFVTQEPEENTADKNSEELVKSDCDEHSEANHEEQEECIESADTDLDTCARKVVTVTQPDQNGLIKPAECHESPDDVTKETSSVCNMTHEDVELTVDNTNLNIEVNITDSVEAMKVEICGNENNPV